MAEFSSGLQQEGARWPGPAECKELSYQQVKALEHICGLGLDKIDLIDLCRGP